jgi:Tol biopolymer transport system component/DNA-binding winged helix-turn-helix (wHTH) protein
VPLAAAEFELLLLLVRNHGRVVEKKEIMASVWNDVEVEENNLTVRMSSLRRALGETKGHHPYIQTVTGRGYCFIVPVNELGDQTETTTTPETFAKTSVSPPPKSRIRGFRLYALLLLALVAASSLVYAVIRWRKGAESQVALQSMKMSRVTQSGRVYHATLSPDGQNVAYVEREGDIYSLWLQRAGTTNPLQLLPPAKVSYLNPVFSRDGNTLYYSRCQPDCELHRIPVLGGVETSLGVRATSPITFSPDGKRMAYMRSDAVETGVLISLLVTDADGTNEHAINSRSDGMAYQSGTPAWSPDGKTIALPLLVSDGKQRHMKIFGFGAADGAESTLSSKGWRFVKDVAWVPDGSGLIINARDEVAAPDLTMQIWHVPLTGGEARRITNDLNNYWSINLSADGRTLMALQMQQSSSLWVAPVENPSAAVQVTRATMDRFDGRGGLSLAPDGRLIYVTQLGSKRDLWSIKMDGSDPRQLTDEPHKDMSPAVTADGRYLVFVSMRDGAPRIWRAEADGRNPTRLTHGSNDTGPVCTPDGQWVIYSTFVDGKMPKLRKVPIGGGEPIALTDEYALYPAVSPDGKTIAYYYMDTKGEQRRRNIVLISAQGGAPIKTLPAPTNFGLVLRWHPKGDALSYRDGQSTGIWRLPLDGTPASAVVNLSGDHLYDFCYSPDGRQLAYASGPDVSDVILIKQFK